MDKYLSKLKLGVMLGRLSGIQQRLVSILLLDSRATVLAQEDQRLNKQHEGDHQQGQKEEVELDVFLGGHVI
jgi:protein-arginine kinase